MSTKLESITSPETVVTKRPANERGQAEHGWLHARFTFSFGDYFDPDHMGFQSLRVMNNDTVEPGGGFPTHPHRDMEIFTYVISGQLEHRDSLGNGATIQAGDLQYMSAGAGIQHSEFNPSKTDPTHLYQVWLRPNESGGSPRYAEKPLGKQAHNTLQLLFSPDGLDDSTAIRQDAAIYFGKLDEGNQITVPRADSRPHLWIQVIEGSVTTMGSTLDQADGLQVENLGQNLVIRANRDSSFLVFQLSSKTTPSQ